jgi:hypothetical protein
VANLLEVFSGILPCEKAAGPEVCQSSWHAVWPVSDKTRYGTKPNNDGSNTHIVLEDKFAQV